MDEIAQVDVLQAKGQLQWPEDHMMYVVFILQVDSM